MFNILKIRKKHGYQAIPDIKKAVTKAPFRGMPLINESSCDRCGKCAGICPVKAIGLKPLSIDMGKCVFCGDCERACERKSIRFTQFHKISADNREALIVTKDVTAENYEPMAVKTREEIKRVFGNSFKLRQVSAGGCNGCEWELNACGNVNFDMGRFGIDFVASPRHADGILITGPITENMAAPLEDAFCCTPDPKAVILAGSCAISGGIFQDSPALKRDFIERHKIDLYIPGCPVHPLTVVNGILRFLGR